MSPLKTGNRILDMLAQCPTETTDFMSSAERIFFAAGEELQKPDLPVAFAYFPASGVLSLSTTLDEETEVNTFAIGRDGAANATPETNIANAAYHLVGQIAGHAWRLPVLEWREILSRTRDFQQIIDRYSEYQLAQLHRSLACELKHDVESRLCRLLLDMHYWQDGGTIVVTHHTLARLLGVRRTTVTLMACGLQEAGIIAGRRGVIEVMDANALRDASCGCHALRDKWICQGGTDVTDVLVHAQPGGHVGSRIMT